MHSENDLMSGFASCLLEDTLKNLVFWSRVGEFGGEYHSIDFRDINKPLEKWIFQNPFTLNGWNDMYITNVMSGFVFLAKQDSLPPRYHLYIQPDCDSNICLVNCSEKILKELHETVTQNLNVSFDKVSDFMECYFARRHKHVKDIYEPPIE